MRMLGFREFSGLWKFCGREKERGLVFSLSTGKTSAGKETKVGERDRRGGMEQKEKSSAG